MIRGRKPQETRLTGLSHDPWHGLAIAVVELALRDLRSKNEKLRNTAILWLISDDVLPWLDALDLDSAAVTEALGIADQGLVSSDD